MRPPNNPTMHIETILTRSHAQPQSGKSQPCNNDLVMLTGALHSIGTVTLADFFILATKRIKLFLSLTSMATAARSPLASSPEKTNGNKLSRLLIDGGTTVLRKIFNRYHPPANLASDLNSNYSILNNLLRKSVVNGYQWDKLFPPGGMAPDSNTFDITLLFLLLTNICGLTTPPSGWHVKPSPGDNSLEANLARVKFFRNELYGHVTSTAFDAAIFSSLWQEISAALLSLGLDQADIDRLKAERGGEQYYIDALIKWADSEEDIKTQLKDIQQSQTKIQTIVEEVRQTQQEQNEMQKEHQRTLQGTQKAVEDTQQLLVEVLKTHQETQQKHEKDHREIRDDLLQIKDKVVSLGDKRSEDKGNEVLKKLAVVDTDTVIQTYAKKYEQGTRKSILEKVKLWLEDRSSENRVLALSGNAGMGKSVIAAVVCQIMHQDGRLAGCHFCQHNKARGRKPQVMLQSLARKLCDVLPKYKTVLAEKLSGNIGVDINSLEVGDLFELLFEEPLSNVGDPGRNFLIVIDGVDECEYQSRNELLDVIAKHFSTLPVWLRFFVTTRPEINIADRLQKFNPIQLKQDDEENVKDIRLFLERQLQSGCEEVINELTRKADGHILFAFLIVRYIEENVSRLDPEEFRKILPSGVSDVYKSYFYRMEKEWKNIEELNISADQFLSFLSAVAAAREPLPLDFVSKLLLSDAKTPAGHRKIRKAIECVSTLLPVQDGCIHFFHKSVKDWLTDSTAYGQHDFSVDEKQGHSDLSNLCTDVLKDVKRKGVHGAEISGTARYALQHGVYHMLESEEVEERTRKFEEIINNYVTDLDIVYAKLCVNDTASSEDIILTQKQEAFQLLSSQSQKAVGTLFFLLRKYHERLSTAPAVFFQVMVNEGGDIFAGEATELLQNRYHEIPYMEYVHKGADEKQMEIQVPFPCSSQVACFDISPQQKFMVCECRDGTIQLWSLDTGKQKWKRPVIVKKLYVDGHGAFREVLNSPVLSCYRSVVFHPTKPIVLPGVLSYTYSVEGDLLPLFSKSNCRFSVCSVNADSMITDCPEDAKCLVMWSLETGEEIIRSNRGEVVLSFAWSPDQKLLAISHLSGLVCLVDALNCFETLAEVTISLPCGMIKFAPNLNFLFCWCKPVISMWERYPKGIRLDIMKLPCGTFSLNVINDNVDYEPWDYESSSKAGFLMGDPVSCLFRRFQDILGPYWILVEGAFAFVVSKQSVLRVFPGNKRIAMFSPDEMKITRTMSCKRLGHVAFAVDGKSVYGVTVDKEAAVVSFDVSSGKRKAKIEISTCRDLHYPKPPFTAVNVSDNGICLVPVTNGVLLKQRYRRTALQLWNFELSQQVQSWPRLSEVTYMMPVTDQCVACVGKGFEVSILDTSSGEIVKTIALCHEGYESTYPLLDKEAIVCNSKYQLLSTDRHSVQLSDGTRILWKRDFKYSLLYSRNIPGIFSPTEEFVLISAKKSQCRQDIHVLHASSGATHRTLCTVDDVMRYAFVSETECVMDCENRQISERFGLRLFSVKTGDLLCVLDMDIRPFCLASFPKKGLIAIGLWQSKRMCAFIKVRMPRDKDNRESKGKQCICFSTNLSIAMQVYVAQTPSHLKKKSIRLRSDL